MGDGEALASKIYANSYEQDPEFADFYLSMGAYKEALSPEKTKMIISPNGEFFKYFTDFSNGSNNLPKVKKNNRAIKKDSNILAPNKEIN